jgi:hypothetical protein
MKINSIASQRLCINGTNGTIQQREQREQLEQMNKDSK